LRSNAVNLSSFFRIFIRLLRVIPSSTNQLAQSASEVISPSLRATAGIQGSTSKANRVRKALRNVLWLGGDKLLSVVAGLLVFGMVARVYGPIGSGHLAFAMAVLQTALGMSLVCSASALLPRLYRQQHAIGGTLANVFVVRLIASITAAVLAAIAVWLFVEEPARQHVAWIVLVTVPLIEPFYLVATYWQSRNANRVPVLSRGTGVLARLAVVSLAVWLGVPLWVVALAWIVEACISASLQAISIRRLEPLKMLRERFTKLRAQTYFKFGVRFVVGLWLSHLYLRLDRLLLSELMAPVDYGFYAAAMQLVEVWLQVATLIGVAMGPAFLYAQLRENKTLSSQWRVFLFMASVGLTGLLLVYLFGAKVMVLVFGAQFAVAYPYLLAGIAFSVLFFMDQVVQIAIAAANQPKLLALRWASACVTALIAQLFLFQVIGPFAGIAGLALGLLVSWLVLAGLWQTSMQKSRGEYA
jgi:polysaccharide transporter, PST family